SVVRQSIIGWAATPPASSIVGRCAVQTNMVAGSVGDTASPCTSVAGAGSAIFSHPLAASGRGVRPLTVAPGVADGVEDASHAVQTSPSTSTTTPRRNHHAENADLQNEPIASSVRMEYPFLPENDKKTLQ
ncbi:MAG: hypothetical protein ACXVDA_27330, partial [Ktedonobacterales bacterium]